MAGYNKGDEYENIIFDLLTTKGLIAPNSARGGAGNQPDIKILHNSQENNLEVKLDIGADYGQKYRFYAVLRIGSKPAKSLYDIEEKNGRIFPPIE